MSKYWSTTVKNIKPYTPGEQPKDKKYIKLNTNENPYPPSPRVIEAIRQVTDESLRLYPDPVCDLLRETIAAYYKVKKEQVFAGNGSDELLAFAYLAFFEPAEKPILFAEITYSFYPVYATLFKTKYKLIAVDDEFNVPAEGYYQENGGIIIANSNAPTGRGVPLKTIKTILGQNKDSVVIIDEAYIDFGGESAVGLIDEYPNLLVIQTMSKSRALAGLRIGYAIGSEGLIEAITRIKDSVNSYTLDRLALAGAVAAIKDDAYFQKTRTKIIQTRERISNRLTEIGFKVIPSQANFIFISYPQYPGSALFQQLREKDILVRYFNKPKIDNFLRVTIGTDVEMDKFLKTIAAIVAKR
jgi:histidinol-phosphate aminotransferase